MSDTAVRLATAVVVVLLGLPAASSRAAAPGPDRYMIQLGPGGRASLLERDRRPLMELVPELLVVRHPVRHGVRRQGGVSARRPAMVARALRFEGPSLERDVAGWQLRYRARDGANVYTLVLRVDPLRPLIALSLGAEYRVDTAVLREALRFHTGRRVALRLLDRAYREVAVSRPQFVGRLTPQRLWLDGAGGSAQLRGGAGVQGMAVRPSADGRFEVELELDDHRNRPLSLNRACVRGIYNVVGHYRVDQVLRRAGERRQLAATIGVGSLASFTPMRFTAGRRAAIAFTDHADQSSATKLEAFAFGETGAIAAKRIGERFAGFINRGLGYTKTIFLRQVPGYAPQFELPRYRELLAQMGKQVEVGVHSPTGGPDTTAASAELLAAFRATYPGRTWIDHQPHTNCEAVTNRGWDPRTRWYMLGLLRRHGFRYLWVGEDRTLAAGSLNLLAPERPTARPAVLYRHALLAGDPRDPLMLFSSAAQFSVRRQFLRAFSEERIARLVRERGLLVSHVYLDTHQWRGRMRGHELLMQTGKDHYRLRPAADRAFARLARHQREGGLWVAGIEAIGEHVLGAMAVHIEPHPDGVAIVRSPKRPLLGFTLRLPAAAVAATVDGLPPRGQRMQDGRLEVWFDLEPGKPRALRLRGADGKPLSLLGNASVLLAGAEDKR